MRYFEWPNDGRDHYPSSPNPYYDPEACGLTILATLEDPDASYSFSTVVAWMDNATGDVYVDHDAGCSCPTPFENVHGLSAMTLVRDVGEIEAFIRYIEAAQHVTYGYGAARDFIRKVSEVLPR